MQQYESESGLDFLKSTSRNPDHAPADPSPVPFLNSFTLSSRAAESPARSHRSENIDLNDSRTLTPRRRKRIEDRLLERAQCSQAKLERKREEQALSEVLQLQETPNISKTSRAILANRTDETPFAIRSLNSYKEKMIRLKMQREEVQAREEIENSVADPEATFTPRINKYSSEMDREKPVYMSCAEWQDRRDKKLAAMKKMKDADETPKSPSISKRSHKIVKRIEERAGQSIHEILSERYKVRKQVLEEKAALQRMEEAPGYPKITNHAAMMERNGDVGERLHQEACLWQEKKKQAIEEAEVEAERQRKSIGNSYTPKSTHPKYFVRTKHHEWSHLPIGEVMMKRTEESAQKRVDLVEKVLEECGITHKPKINEKSRELAAKCGKSTAERLWQRKQLRKTHDEHVTDPEEFPTFTPEINEVSKQLDAARYRGTQMDRVKKLHNDHKRIMEKRQKDAAEKVADEESLSECTFKPRLNVSSQSLGSYADNANSEPVYDRLKKWKERKEKWVKVQRLIRAEEESKNCTFKPAAEKRRVVDDEPSLEDLGVNQFVERMQKGREQRAQKELKADRTAGKWKNERTVPMEFQFTRPGKHNIRALQKPVVPAEIDYETEANREPVRKQAWQDSSNTEMALRDFEDSESALRQAQEAVEGAKNAVARSKRDKLAPGHTSSRTSVPQYAQPITPRSARNAMSVKNRQSNKPASKPRPQTSSRAIPREPNRQSNTSSRSSSVDRSLAAETRQREQEAEKHGQPVHNTTVRDALMEMLHQDVLNTEK